MLEILKFIFSDFFIWLGTVILVAITGEALSGIIDSITNHRKDK